MPQKFQMVRMLTGASQTFLAYDFFSVSDSATETPTSYMISDPGISDAYTHYTETDTEHGVDLEATVYLMPASASVFYINPVYQDGDGAVYVTSGNGVSMGDSWAEGARFFHRKLEATSKSSNSIRDRTSISIRLETCNVPDSFTILQMSEQNTPIAPKQAMRQTPCRIPLPFQPKQPMCS